jgi:hypothetical protein
MTDPKPTPTAEDMIDFLECNPDIHIEMDYKGVWSIRWRVQAGGDLYEVEAGSIRDALREMIGGRANVIGN